MFGLSQMRRRPEKGPGHITDANCPCCPLEGRGCSLHKCQFACVLKKIPLVHPSSQFSRIHEWTPRRLNCEPFIRVVSPADRELRALLEVPLNQILITFTAQFPPQEV